MRSIPLLVALSVTAGCAVTHVSAPTSPMPMSSAVAVTAPSPSTPATSSPTSPVASASGDGTPLSFNGRWAFGTTDEPAPGSDSQCRAVYELTIEDGIAHLTSNACGASYEDSKGTFDGRRLSLAGTYLDTKGEKPVRYDLNYDPASEHFRGTRLDAPFWMARSIAVCPSPASLCPSVLRGVVYNDAGDSVGGTTVTVRSLNPSNPFESTVEVINGHYVVNNVPALARMEVTASAPGFIPRVRERMILPNGIANVLNFGGPLAEEDPDGASYPLERDLQASPSPSPEAQASSATAD